MSDEKSKPVQHIHPSHEMINASLIGERDVCINCHAHPGDATLAIECAPKLKPLDPGPAVAGREAKGEPTSDQRAAMAKLAAARDAGDLADKEIEFLQRACVELQAFHVGAQRRLLAYLARRFGVLGAYDEVPY